MKIRILLTVLLASLLSASFVQAGDTPLDDKMDSINKAFRQLKKQVAEPAQNTSSLELIAKIKEASLASLELDPSKTAALPEKDRAAFVADYKTKMTAFVAELDKLVVELKANDNSAAVKRVAELGALQRSGHKEFRQQKPKD